MIYTACYHDYACLHGKLIPISFGIPSFEYKFKLEPPLKFFIPQASFLRNGRANKITEEQYTKVYREEIKDNWCVIQDWLNSLKPEENMTLLAWEKPEQFSHRNLVLKLVEKYRPDCYGGANVVNKCPLVV